MLSRTHWCICYHTLYSDDEDRGGVGVEVKARYCSHTCMHTRAHAAVLFQN